MSPVLSHSPDGDIPAVVERGELPALFEALVTRGYALIGPTVRDNAITYGDLATVDDLPVGWTDEQNAGTYRLAHRDDGALFGYTVGPHSWKQLLWPPRVQLMRARRENGVLSFYQDDPAPAKMAFIGVRACELHAMSIQDKVFLQGQYQDPIYAARRGGAFIVAVNCGLAGGTCFCASMHTGPRADAGFDLALTEVLEAGRHYFVVETGSDAGREVLQNIPNRGASQAEQEAASGIVARTAESMGRTLDMDGLQEFLYANHDNPRWDAVADRCLSCASCTMVCPTCFCMSVEDVTDLKGGMAERYRVWASCFSIYYSYIHGGSVRRSVKARYRQWLTHKLATWAEQFGVPGCVGCGRCITWCPVSIDITEEVRAMRPSSAEPNLAGRHGGAAARTGRGNVQ